MPRFSRTLPLPALLALAVFLPLAAGPAGAGGPKALDVAGDDDFGKGTLEDLSLSGDGVLRPGPAFEALPLEVPTAWAAVLSGDSLWIGCGNEPVVKRVTKAGKVETIALGE